MIKQDQKKNIYPRFIFRYVLLSLIIFLIFSIGFIPLVFSFKLFLNYIDIDNVFHWFLIPFIIYIEFLILIISELLISGLIIYLFRIRYKPGEFDYSFGNWNAFKWILICSLYTPCRKIIEIIPLGGIKNLYYRLLGMKIGKNSLVGGVIKDPCVTEFGENITMGEYAIIYGHILNYNDGKINISKVKIGNNCVIGAGSIIMPGAVLKDNIILAAGAVVSQNQILDENKTYGGIPAKEIKNRK
jgi:acetyltransferase-like isoleucine patch superfamily enzyme